MSFSRAELKAFTGGILPDLHEPGRARRRATASAGELGPAELIAGARALEQRVRPFRPHVVAILGITAYRTAFGLPRAGVGRQPADLAGAQLWVVPNPSGRNAHASLDTLAAAYREVAVAAGVPVRDLT